MATRGVPRLFVGNLPWTVGKKELRDYFSQFGFVSNVNVIFSKENGLSKGFGFVKLSTKDGYIAATSKEQHILEGNVITVQPANSNENFS